MNNRQTDLQPDNIHEESMDTCDLLWAAFINYNMVKYFEILNGLYITSYMEP